MRPSQLRIVIGAAAVLGLAVAVLVLFSGQSTNVTLTIEGSGGRVEVCASSLTAVGDDVVELGGASIAGPQWLEAEGRTTVARVAGPGVGVSGAAELRVTFVGEDGIVLSQQRVDEDPLTSPAPWSAALVEASSAREEHTTITAEAGC